MGFLVGYLTENSKEMGVKKGLVRMAWEKPYLEILIDNLHPFNKVLEVGFSLGHSAARIQAYSPTHHTIIEYDPDTAAKAIKWAENNPTITVMQDSWENALPKLGIFDAIFFNEFERGVEGERSQYCEVIQKGKELLSTVKEQIPELLSRRYSDSDIDGFFDQVGLFHLNEMANFLHDLKGNGQISEQQYEKMIDKYRLVKKEDSILRIEKPIDGMFVFLETCLKSHMGKGSRFSYFAGSPLSKYEDPAFFESIITNPNVSYQEKIIAIDVPDSCEYYKHKEALVMIVEKLI